jgi:hypothetical protein
MTTGRATTATALDALGLNGCFISVRSDNGIGPFQSPAPAQCLEQAGFVEGTRIPQDPGNPTA